MKKSNRQTRKELRAKIYRTLDPQEKEARRKYTLQSFLIFFLIALIILVTVTVILVRRPGEQMSETVPQSSAEVREPYFSVVLDPGHGFGNDGASLNGETEAKRCLEVAKKVKLLLEDAGYAVYISRDEETDGITPAERAAICDGFGANAVISVHFCSESGAYYSLIPEKTVTSGRMAKFFSPSPEKDNESEFLSSLKTPAVRLNIPWQTEDSTATEKVLDGIVKYAEYAHENGIV